jgi:hypothetical protein
MVTNLFLAFTSIEGGRILLLDPSGTTLGLQPMVPYLPFDMQDFTLVGIWLIAVFGALPIILATGLWFGRKWAWGIGLGLGAVLIMWIIVEVFLFYSFGFTFFYPLYAGIGSLTIIISCLRATREFFVMVGRK